MSCINDNVNDPLSSAKYRKREQCGSESAVVIESNVCSHHNGTTVFSGFKSTFITQNIEQNRGDQLIPRIAYNRESELKMCPCCNFFHNYRPSIVTK